MFSLDSELSPAQHTRINRQLALIPAYMWLVQGWRTVLTNLPVGPGASGDNLRDFLGVAYLPGWIAAWGTRGALYDMEQRDAVLAKLMPAAAALRYPPFYPPQMSVLFSPLARLPYDRALAIWMAISVAIYFVCGYLVWRACPRLADRGGTVLLLLLGDPALFYVLSFGQISPIGLLCVTGGFLALRAGWPLVAGIAIGSLVYKPTMGLAAACVLLAASVARDGSDDRRIVAGAILGAAAQFAVGAIFWGPTILVDYIRSIPRLVPEMRDQFFIHHLHSLRGFFEQLGLPAGATLVLSVTTSAVVLFITWRCWRSPAPLAVRYGVLLLATVLVSPHMYVYDLVILMPAFLLIWDASEAMADRTIGEVLPWAPFASLRRRRMAPAIAWLLYFCYLSPRFAIVAAVTGVQLSVPALTLLAVAMIAAAPALPGPSRGPDRRIVAS